jgi:glutamate dehydrogenase/leucine dehydrogenase
MANVQENPSGAWNASPLAGPLPNFYANQLTASANASVGNLYSVALAGAATLTLPDATANAGGVIAVVLTAANSHTLTVESAVNGQTVGGEATQTMSTALDSLLLASDGSNYILLSIINDD